MNQISENLFAAIDIIIKERLKDLPFDRTIVGNVFQTFDGTNKYEIIYQGIILTAYSNNEYKVGDSVYVLIPENDMSNRKLIIGKYGTGQGGEVDET